MSDIVIRPGVGNPVQIRAGIGSPISIAPPLPAAAGIVTDQLIVHLDAANASSYSGTGTTWYDLSGNGNNFTLVNTPTFTSNGDASTFEFEAASLERAESTNSINLQRDFSLEVWANFNNVGSYRAVFGQGTTAANQALAAMVDGNRLFFSMYFSDFTVNTASLTSTWYHLVFTYNHSSPYTKQIYRNGTLAGESTSGQGQYAGSGILRVGAPYSSVNVETMEGKIPVARVYTKILSSTEILQNYNAQKARYGL